MSNTSAPANGDFRSDSPNPSNVVFNVPNTLTFARLVLVGVVCALLEVDAYLAALLVFLFAASTDWVDGYWARRFNQVTKIGRMFDPFVDKVIIGSVFIYLSSIPDSGVPAWATVIVVGRELLVTALRSAVEAAGGDFSASQSGKWKMVAQCGLAVASMLSLHLAKEVDWILYSRLGLLIATMVLTIHSAVGYVSAAFRYLTSDPPASESLAAESLRTDLPAKDADA